MLIKLISSVVFVAGFASVRCHIIQMISLWYNVTTAMNGTYIYMSVTSFFLHFQSLIHCQLLTWDSLVQVYILVCRCLCRFHPKCVGMTQAVAMKLDKYVCDDCASGKHVKKRPAGPPADQVGLIHRMTVQYSTILSLLLLLFHR